MFDIMKKLIYYPLSFFYFWFAYLAIFTTSYLMHFPIIHNVPFVSYNHPDYFAEWCPFPFSHNTPMLEISQWENFNLITLGLSLFTTIAFFYLKRKGRWTLLLSPIAIISILIGISYLYY